MGHEMRGLSSSFDKRFRLYERARVSLIMSIVVTATAMLVPEWWWF